MRKLYLFCPAPNLHTAECKELENLCRQCHCLDKQCTRQWGNVVLRWMFSLRSRTRCWHVPVLTLSKSHIGRQTECETSTHCHSQNGLWSGLLFKWVLFYLKLWATWSIKKLFSASSQFFPWKRFPSVSSSSKAWLTLHLEPESIDIEEFCIQQTILSIFFSPHP